MATPDGVELVPSDACGFVSRLKQQPGKGICPMGGGCVLMTYRVMN